LAWDRNFKGHWLCLKPCVLLRKLLLTPVLPAVIKTLLKSVLETLLKNSAPSG